MVVIAPAGGGTKSPQRRCWTRKEFDRAEDLGLFGPEERLELIGGVIYVKERTVKAPHAVAQRRTEKTFSLVFSEGYDVRGQLPLALGTHDQPMPDVAVVVGTADDYIHDHPTTAVLVVEISDTTLRFDRNTKAGQYARAGIPDYWILNINARTLEVHRQPVPMRGRPLGHYYSDVTSYTATDSV